MKSSSFFTSEADFENLIVSYRPTVASTEASRANGGTENRAPIYLREVATARFENARPENIVRINGERCIGLSVYKEMQYNTVRVVDRIDRQLKAMEQALPGYRFQVIRNQGTFINQTIGEVKSTVHFVSYIFLILSD